MGFPEIMDFVAGLLQFIVAGYALRLNRLFGTARIGWSLFWAFLLLALLHLVQSIAPLPAADEIEIQNEIAVTHALVSLLLLTGLVHLENVLKERVRLEQKELRLRAELELEVQRKTECLTRAVDDLQVKIDEHRRTEKALQMFQFTTDHAADGVFWLDDNAGFYYVNDEACRSLGYAREELMRLHLADVDPSQSKELWTRCWKQFQASENVLRHLESVHRRKDGSAFPVEVTAKRFSIGGKDLHVAFVRDITERRKAEEKNRQQAILLDEATDAIWGIDLNEHISFWNKGAERIYGWSAAEAIGKNPVELLCHGTVTPQYAACLQAVKTHGAWSGELEEFTKDGRSIITHGRCNAIKDGQNRLQSLLVINTDITEKKKLEAQLLRSQRMESLGTLAGGIAHDLNNILSPVLFSLYLLRDKVADLEGRQLLDTMETSVQRGAGLIKQVLAFGRGIRGDRVPVQLDQLVREVEQIISETFPKSVEFEARFAARPWHVKGDATQLHQVLLNLCVNARDAMPDGGKLSIHIENVELNETHAKQDLEARPGPYVVIQVADTGSGIPKQILDRIFEPFFTTKEVNKGTGLGLSTCLGIVRSHGGFINCTSEPGKGSTFKVHLPASVTSNTVHQPAAERIQPSRGNGELVLVVDDEYPIRNVAQKTLERFGYRVLTAANGAEAVALYRQKREEIAVVVMDMAMPVMDGHTAIAALKIINPEVPIIGASGLDIPGSLNRDTDFGCCRFMPKPYSAETLLNTLNDVLASKAAA